MTRLEEDPGNSRPIGIFDSGVGGLTVLRQLLRRLPSERMIYLGDTARLPYGTKSRETVVKYSLKNTSFLVEKGIKCLVVACNTASSLALEALRQAFPIPVLGVIQPGAERAARLTRNGRVGVIGTVATIRSRAYEEVIRTVESSIEVVSVPCPLFVSLAEEGWTQDEVTYLVAERYLEPLRKRDVDVLVLGCTHYPLLKSVISGIMGEKVRLVDSAEEIAVQVRNLLDQNGTRNAGRERCAPKVYMTDSSPHFLELAQMILSLPATEFEYVDL
ncbi:MAG: glutamate racemase [bacterium]